MKVFLTGATGYIGTVIAEKLQEAGHTVVGLARNESSAIEPPIVGDEGFSLLNLLARFNRS